MDKRIKMMILIPSLTSGGQERYISILCNNINTDLFDVSLYVINNKNAFFTIHNKNIKVVDLGIERVRNSFFKIYAAVKKEKPAIVFTTGHHLNLFFAITKKFLPGKFTLVARESTIVSLNNRMQKTFAIFNRLDKIFYRNIDFIICQSNAMQADLIANYSVSREKTMVINNFVEDIAGQALHKEVIHTVEGVYSFVTVARLSKEKGIPRIIEALSKLTIPYKYYIFGGGPERSALEALTAQLNLQDKVILFDETVNPFGKVDNIDLFLMGSFYEGFPNVLLEAGIRGIPIVAFKSAGGSNEIIMPGINGLIAEHESDFPGLVLEALEFPFDKLKIRENILSKYSVHPIIKKVEELFVKLGGTS